MNPKDYELVADHTHEVAMRYYQQSNKDRLNEKFNEIYDIKELTEEEKGELEKIKKELDELKKSLKENEDKKKEDEERKKKQLKTWQRLIQEQIKKK